MALHMAVEKGNPDIVQLLLNREEIDVNIRSVCNFFLIYKISFYFFHYVHKSKIQTSLQTKLFNSILYSIIKFRFYINYFMEFLKIYFE